MSNQNTPIFDTHAAVKRLTEAGMPTSQAEAVVQSQADILAHNLANKRDIELIRKDIAVIHEDIAVIHENIASLRDETKKDIASLREETKTDIASFREETKKDIELLRAELGRDLAQGLHRQSRFLITSLMGFAVLIMAFIEFRLLV